MRRTEEVLIVSDDPENRDRNKVFVLTEMPAMQGEKWATRMLLALARSGADLGEISALGMAGLAIAGIQAMPAIDFRDAEPLMDEMLGCVKVKTSSGLIRALHQPGDDGDDIQELTTLLELRKRILELHTRFFMKGTSSNSTTGTTKTSPVSPSA